VQSAQQNFKYNKHETTRRIFTFH